MTFIRCVALAAAVLAALPAAASAQQTELRDLPSVLRFDAAAPDGTPAGWFGGPTGTLFADSEAVRSAPYSGRIERGPTSQGQFSALTIRVPASFAGDTLELSGWLRTRDVTGFAGLWLREDGPSGPVAFDNMQQRPIIGTTAWSRYTIRLPLERAARFVYLGALLAGQGTAWVDDLELRVDGRPPAQAPPRPAGSAAEPDREPAAPSGIATQSLSPAQVTNLTLLGQVWGFVKYHDPRVTQGQVDWDHELFRVLPDVLNAPDPASGRSVLAGWLARRGDPPPCAPCAPDPAETGVAPAPGGERAASDAGRAAAPERDRAAGPGIDAAGSGGFALAPDIAWIHDRAALGDELSARLEAIYRNRSAAEAQRYVKPTPGVGNPDFSGEASYAGGTPDAGYRLLALYRLWNIVEYWFPDRDVIGERWAGVLREFVPRLMAAGDPDDYVLTLMQLIARVHDTHANLWQALGLRPPSGDAQLPVTLRFVQGHAVVTGYSSPTLGPATGLRPGDAIERISGMPVDSLVAAWAPLYAASNQAARLRDMALALTRGATGPVDIRVLRAGRRLELTPERAPSSQLDPQAGRTHDLPGDAFRMLTPEVAYLKLSAVSGAAIPEYLRRAAAAKVLVVDIRNYPREFVVFSLGGHFVEKPTAFARFTMGQPANPGAFVWGPTVSLQPLQPHFGGRIVILVDETTQSSAEYTAMAFRAAPGAMVVGSTTAGADGNVSSIPLPGGVTTMISGIGVFWPDGRPTQRVGIVPDLVVEPTIGGIRAGRDEVLEAGVSRALGRPFRLPPE